MDNPRNTRPDYTNQSTQRSPDMTGGLGQRQDINRPNEIRSRDIPDLQSQQDRLNDLLNQNNGLRPDLTLRPTEPPTEFQRAIHLLIGAKLKVFGRNLFLDSPSTFAPVDHVPVTANYVIGPEDELMVRAWGQIDVDYKATVDRAGNIFVPKVGSLHVAGLRYDQLDGFLRTAIGRV